ncbi:hypothetical protein V2J09_016238 [Rumex salicifolius]
MFDELQSMAANKVLELVKDTKKSIVNGSIRPNMTLLAIWNDISFHNTITTFEFTENIVDSVYERCFLRDRDKKILRLIIVASCDPNIVPIQMRNKFSLSQCPQTDLELDE